MKNRIKSFLGGLKLYVLNHLVNKIPCWLIRKFFYRASGVKLGKKSRIGLNTVLLKPSKIRIGEDSVVNENCFLDGRGNLVIGDHVSISSFSKIITASHTLDSFEFICCPLTIDDYVWIGTGAIVIGDGKLSSYSIVGAGAVLKGSTIEKGIYIGNPAKLLKTRQDVFNYVINYHPFFR